MSFQPYSFVYTPPPTVPPPPVAAVAPSPAITSTTSLAGRSLAVSASNAIADLLPVSAYLKTAVLQAAASQKIVLDPAADLLVRQSASRLLSAGREITSIDTGLYHSVVKTGLAAMAAEMNVAGTPVIVDPQQRADLISVAQAFESGVLELDPARWTPLFLRQLESDDFIHNQLLGILGTVPAASPLSPPAARAGVPAPNELDLHPDIAAALQQYASRTRGWYAGLFGQLAAPGAVQQATPQLSTSFSKSPAHQLDAIASAARAVLSAFFRARFGSAQSGRTSILYPRLIPEVLGLAVNSHLLTQHGRSVTSSITAGVATDLGLDPTRSAAVLATMPVLSGARPANPDSPASQLDTGLQTGETALSLLGFVQNERSRHVNRINSAASKFLEDRAALTSTLTGLSSGARQLQSMITALDQVRVSPARSRASTPLQVSAQSTAPSSINDVRISGEGGITYSVDHMPPMPRQLRDAIIEHGIGVRTAAAVKE